MNISDFMAIATGQKQADFGNTQSKGDSPTISQSTTNDTTSTSSQTDASANTAATVSAEAQSSIATEFNTFLNLLTAQIQNQDPLAPLDSTQFVEQLATFSNLELQAEGNQTLDDIAGLLSQAVELYTANNTATPIQTT